MPKIAPIPLFHNTTTRHTPALPTEAVRTQTETWAHKEAKGAASAQGESAAGSTSSQ